MELRRHPRLEYDRRAWCEHQNLTLYLPIVNISRGGVFLQTSAAFGVGDIVRVSLDVESIQPSRVVADVEVVWSGRAGRQTGIGCRIASFCEGQDTYMRLLDRLSTHA